MAFLINHPFVCLDRKEPNYLSQHLICNRDSKLHYLNVNIEGCAPWGRDGTALSQSKGPSGLWHLPLPHACSWHLHSPPCLGHARGSGAALPAGLWPQHSASGSTTHSENSKGNFFCFIKAGFSETCGREFLDMPQAGRGGEEHVHFGVLRAHEGHKITPWGWLTFPQLSDALRKTSQAVETRHCSALCRQDVTLIASSLRHSKCCTKLSAS